MLRTTKKLLIYKIVIGQVCKDIWNRQSWLRKKNNQADRTMGSISSNTIKLDNIYIWPNVATELGCSKEQMFNNQIGLNRASMALEVSAGIELRSEANITRPPVLCPFYYNRLSAKQDHFSSKPEYMWATSLVIFLHT